MKTIVRGAGATLLMVALSAGATRTANAAPIGLSYEADPSCPGASTFASLVHRQAPSVDLTPVEFGLAEVFVAIRSIGKVFRGRLQILVGDGSTYIREMEEASCSDLGPALAFVAALALSGQQVPPAGAPTEPPRVPPPADQPASVPVLAPNRSWGWGVGAGVGVRYGIAPTWANTEQIVVEIRSLDDALLAPSFQAALLHAEPVTRIDRAGTTEFTWIAGRLAGCPLHVRPFVSLDLSPCVGIDAGSIGASGVPSDNRGRGSDSHSFWAEGFATAHVRVHLAGPLFATGEAELTLPLTPYSFAFDPGTPVYDVPTVAGAGGLGLFAQIP
jgi:hypothetical protein